MKVAPGQTSNKTHKEPPDDQLLGTYCSFQFGWLDGISSFRIEHSQRAPDIPAFSAQRTSASLEECWDMQNNEVQGIHLSLLASLLGAMIANLGCNFIFLLQSWHFRCNTMHCLALDSLQCITPAFEALRKREDVYACHVPFPFSGPLSQELK